METAVQFPNSRGELLSGVLHTPDGARHPNAAGVLWLSAGQKVRQGAWRMNVAVARRLAAMGIPSLRFDFHGIGDSEGELPNDIPVMDLYGFIQTGGFRDDTVCAAQFLQRETGVRSLVLGGLCGGGISGLFAGQHIDGVFGHVLVDLPVTISSSARQRFLEENAAELLRSRPGETDTVILLYLRKLTDLGAWRRLLSGESDYKLLIEALRLKSRERLDGLLTRLNPVRRAAVERLIAPILPPVAPEVEPEVDAAVAARMAASGEVRNEAVGEVFRTVMARGQRVRFVNSSAYHKTFMGYFGNHELKGDAARWRSLGVELIEVPDANHIFSLEASQRALFTAVEEMALEASRNA